MTNATHVDRENYLNKLHNYGFETNLDRIYNATYLSLSSIKKDFPEIKNLFIIGMEPVIKEA